MQDIPIFTTEYGVASLGLKEIPHTGSAYITYQSTSNFLQFHNECVDFCKMAGASHIYARGNSELMTQFPFFSVYKMICHKECLQDTDAALFPVQNETLEKWRKLYNEKMRSVPGAAFLSTKDAEKILAQKNAYFVHRGNLLLGIGTASGNCIGAIASFVKNGGKDVILALCHALTDDIVSLEVASVNEKAIALYRSLGFVATEEVTRWYQIL